MSIQVNGVEIEDTFAEAFPMFAGRILITAQNEKWAKIAARTATGFASSIIMSPAEAAMEGPVIPPEKTPDGRPGVMVQMYHNAKPLLKGQMISRMGQCILTCPTTAAFDGLPSLKNKMKIGDAVRMFGDGFEKKDVIGGRKVWRLPVMEGEFVIEGRFGIKKAIAGGNLLIMAENQPSALEAAEKCVDSIQELQAVVLTFPGGICRSGSKLGSKKYKLPASTNHPICPQIRSEVPDTQIPEGVTSVYEVVFNALDEDLLMKGTAKGIEAAASVPGVKKISAANFGGTLGPVQIKLKDAVALI
jgi:formylmethanofuran--tetrahydromethanopterin N-formyltransferase